MMRLGFGGAWILILVVLKFTVASQISWGLIFAPAILGILFLAFMAAMVLIKKGD